MLSNYPNIMEQMNKVEKILQRSIRSKQPLVNQATQELLASGGKRLRPLLMLVSSMLGEYIEERILPIAAAIEILHMATLVHDDIIDDAHLRRNSETVQSKWGKDVAVFTGDFLLCKAFLLISSYNDIANIKKLAKAMRVICEGEIQQYQHRYKTNLSVIGYLKRIAAKTAILFSISGYVGAYEAKCSKRIINACANFGMNMGMAFQITDDILDFTGKRTVLGKPINSDWAQGIYTLPIIYALKDKKYGDEMRKCLEEDMDLKEKASVINELVFRSGGIAYARKMAQKYINKAYDNLNILPPGPSREVMEDMIERLINREK